MEDKKLTEKESLEVITSMIARTKQRYLGSGNILLMWGYLIVTVTVLVWILLVNTRHNYWNWLWFLIPAIGMPTTVIMTRNKQRDHGVITYSDKVSSRLWSIFGISIIGLTLICLGFTFIGDINCWSAMLIYSLLLVPGTEIAQGLIVRENSLVTGAIIGLAVGMVTVCCIAGGVSLDVNWFMPLFILAFAAMMIVPGHILNHKAKNQ